MGKNTTKTAYQTNLQTTTPKSNSNMTTREALSEISFLSKYDKSAANNFMQKLSYSMQDASSQFYNPYTQATNKAVNNLKNLGFDMSVIDDDWYNRNSWLKNYYVTTANTNGLSSTMTNKRASKEQKAAYNYNQLWMAEENTRKAETEWAALQEELNYWATNKTRNYSDEEIINKIDWSKYKTLQKMDETRLQGTPMELNRAIGYSEDALYGVLWAARNGGSTGDLWTDMANSASGTGWVDNPTIRAKLDAGNLDTYSPYSVGSTMEKEGLYFGRESFDQKWLDENRALYMGGNDETAKKMYQNVYEAEQYTQKLESQLSQMKADVDSLLATSDDPEAILNALKYGSDAYNDLFDLDESMASGKLKDTTRAIDYRWQDIEKYVRDQCEKKNNRETTEDLVSFTTGNQNENDAVSELGAYYRTNVKETVPTITEKGTPTEKTVVSTAKTPNYDLAQDALKNADITPEKTAADITQMTVDQYKEYFGITYDYETHQKELSNAEQQRALNAEELQSLRDRNATMSAVGEASQEQIDRLNALANMPAGQDEEWDWVRSMLQNPSNDPYDVQGALDILYQRVTGNMLSLYDDETAEGEREKARQWFNYISTDNRSPMDKLIAEAQTDQGDTDEFGTEVEVPGTNGGHMLEVNFERNPDGSVSFIGAHDNVTDKSYGPENIDEINELLGYQPMQALTDEEKKRLTILEESNAELSQKIDDETAYLKNNESIYEDALLDKQILLESYAAAASVSNGEMDATLLPSIEAGYILGNTPVAPEYLSDSVIDMGVRDGTITKEEANKEAMSIVTDSLKDAKSLQNILDILTKYNVPLTDEQIKNINDRIMLAKENAKGASYVALDGQPDYEENVDKAYKWLNNTYNAETGKYDYNKYGYLAAAITNIKNGREDNVPNNLPGENRARNDAKELANLMTEEERNRYMYLLSKEGKIEADKYVNFLTNEKNGALAVRRNENLFNEYKANASKDGISALLYTLQSFGTKVLGGIADISQLIDTKVFGAEYKPFSRTRDLTTMTNAIRSGSKEYLKGVAGDNKDLANLLDVTYDAVTSAVDSRVNAKIMDKALDLLGKAFNPANFGVVIPEGAKNVAYNIGQTKVGQTAVKVANDFTHAAGMGLEAAASTYNDVYIRTGDENKATMMAMATFFAEAGSEAITYGNITDAFKAGNDEAKRSLANFVKEFFSNGAEEFFGEGVNQWIEQNADTLIMGAESEYAKRVAELKANGYSTTMAESIAGSEAWKEILRSGAIGFLSSSFGTPVDYLRGYISDRANTEGPAVIPGSNGAITQDDVNMQGEASNGTFASGFGSAEAAIRNKQETDEVRKNNLQFAKDIDILAGASRGDETSAAVAISSVFGTGNNRTDQATGQAMVGNMAGGRPKVAIRAAQGILTTFRTMQQAGTTVSMDTLKSSLSYAAMTSGKGHDALQKVFNKSARGMQITQQNVNDILDGIKQDRAENPRAFEKQYLDSLREYRIANYTIRNMASKEMRARLKPAEDAVKTANENLDNAKRNAKQAHAKVDTVAESVKAAAEEYSPSDPSKPVNQEAAGTLEQTRNELAGAITDANTADNAVTVQQQKKDKVQKDLNEVRNEVMAEARASATQEVAQEQQQEAETAYNNGIAAAQPLVAFGHSIQVFDSEGNPVNLTGVYDLAYGTSIRGERRNARGNVHAEQDEYGRRLLGVVYTTEDGRLVMEPASHYENGQMVDPTGRGIVDTEGNEEAMAAADRLTPESLTGENTMVPKVRPAVYFPSSFPVNINGQEIQMIGLAGKQNLDGEEYPVIMGIDGTTYSTADPNLEIPFDDVDTVDEVFDANADNLQPIDNVQPITGGNVNAGEERTEDSGQDGLPVQGTVGEGNNDGQLPLASGRDDGSGDNGDVGSDGGQEGNGGTEESPTESDGQAVRGDPERLLSRKTKKKLKEKGVTDLKLNLESNPERFSSALDAAKANNDHGLFVDAQSPETLEEKGAIMILSQNGLSGAAVGTEGSETGNIFGVFKNKQSRARKASASLIIQAVAQGGNKLDCYDGGLRGLYSSVGMVPVAKVPFNRDYAPDGWNYERDGEPDVVVWMLKPGETAESIADKYGLPESEGGFHRYTDEEMQTLPVFEDYDEALKYRDEMLANGDMPTFEVAEKDVNEPPTGTPVNESTTHGNVNGEFDQQTFTPPTVNNRTNGPVRQWNTQMAQDSEVLHDQIKKYLLDNAVYDARSNQEDIDNAISWVTGHATDGDPSGFWSAMTEALSDNFNPLSVNGQARTMVLMSMAANNGFTDAEQRLADLYMRTRTEVGQALQIGKMFRLMTPSGRKSVLENEARKIEEEYRARGKKGLKLEISNEVLEKAANAKTEQDFVEARQQMEKELAAQIPSDWRLKMRTFRMAAMLANPRTHIRNLEGNFMFNLPLAIKNAIGTGLEKAAGVEVGKRTKAIKHTQESKDFAKEDAKKQQARLQGTSKFFEVGAVEANRKAFGTGDSTLSKTLGRAIQWAADKNGDVLEKEDWISLNRHYVNAMASFMTANGYTAKDMTGETLEKAREYAISEAQKATYRDANKLAKWFSDQSNKPAAAQFFINAIMPFTKTPMNIVRRGVEYSPFGLAYSLATGKRQLEAYNEWEKSGFEGRKPNGAKSPSEVFDRVASGLTGTMLVGLGAFLSRIGMLKVNPPDDEKRKGSQDYSLEIGGKSIGIGNMLPTALPILLGGSIYEEVERMKGEENVDFGGILQALGNMAQPTIETTMMMSWNNLLDTSRYSTNGDVTTSSLVQKVLANYASSFIPSIVGSIARTVDPTQRKAYVESGDNLSIWTALREQTENKIPFLSKSNVPYLDQWGEENTSSHFKAFLDNFILPDKIQDLKDSEVDDKLAEITNQTGIEVGPNSTNAKTLTVNGESVKLDDKQWYQYSSERGKISKETLQELIERPEFVILSPEVQADLVKKVYKYANAKAALELFPDKNITDGWTKGSLTADNVVDYIIEKEEESARDASNDEHRASLYKAIEQGNLEAAMVDIDALRTGGVTDESIRDSITRKIKPLYKQAAQEDPEEMARIRSFLMMLGLKFNFSNWTK